MEYIAIAQDAQAALVYWTGKQWSHYRREARRMTRQEAEEVMDLRSPLPARKGFRRIEVAA